MYTGCFSATGCRDDDSIDRREAMHVVPLADMARPVHRSRTFLTGLAENAILETTWVHANKGFLCLILGENTIE